MIMTWYQIYHYAQIISLIIIYIVCIPQKHTEVIIVTKTFLSLSMASFIIINGNCYGMLFCNFDRVVLLDIIGNPCHV